ncbi:MAG: KTSC domain-containing protein [Hymenobacter sp.]|nr:MAG: KTSC domain-containing protein [Hymenobacter sp.]
MKYLAIASFIALASCSNKSSEIPESFTSYKEANQKISAGNYKIEETVDVSRSSWIKGAKFYSEDGQSGYLFLKVGNREYIHKGVPIDVWNQFKTADSFGKYYRANIMHRYQLQLEK